MAESHHGDAEFRQLVAIGLDDTAVPLEDERSRAHDPLGGGLKKLTRRRRGRQGTSAASFPPA